MSSFAGFLKNIRPDQQLRDACRTAHLRLRENVTQDDETGPITIHDALQGSYARSTLVKPQPGKKADVDLLAITKIPDTAPVENAVGPFKRMLDKRYRGKWTEDQARSLGIDDGDVELDLVVTAAPAMMDPDLLPEALAKTFSMDELELDGLEDGRSLFALNKALRSDYKDDPLRIPDRARQFWDDTHPLKQIEHHRMRQRQTGRKLIDVVRVIKWWKYYQTYLDENRMPKYPKGFPLERMVEYHCPDNMDSVEEGVVRVFEEWLKRIKPLVDGGQRPDLRDTGLEDRNVLERVPLDHLQTMMQRVEEALPTAQDAYRCRTSDPVRSAQLWQQLFGPEFPVPQGQPNHDEGGEGHRFVPDPPRKRPDKVPRGEFA